MKRNIFRVSILVFIIFFIINSCGVILDITKIQGKWDLDSVIFYSYNKDLDSYRAYPSNTSNEFSNYSLPISIFFDNFDMDRTPEHTFQIEFLTSKDFNIVRNNNENDVFVNSAFTSYILDTFDNSITLKISESALPTDPTSDRTSFWRSKNFSFKQYWPMSDYKTLELYLRLEEIGIGAIDINKLCEDVTDNRNTLTNKVVITHMLGTFIKL